VHSPLELLYTVITPAILVGRRCGVSRNLLALLPPPLEVERSICSQCLNRDRRCIKGLKTARLGESRKKGKRAKGDFLVRPLRRGTAGRSQVPAVCMSTCQLPVAGPSDGMQSGDKNELKRHIH
jgi:hypothetical protein